MRKLFYIMFLIVFFTQTSNAQRWKLRRYGFDFGVGSSNYFGDIGGSADKSNLFGLKDIKFNSSKPLFRFGILYKLDANLDIIANANYGFLSGKDAGSRNEIRNLSFNSKVLETSAQLNYIFYSQRDMYAGNIFSRKGMNNGFLKFSLYVFGGFGMSFLNPKIGPESVISVRRQSGVDEFKSTNSTMVVPLGIGTFFLFSADWIIKFEVGPRITLTDQLDGFASKYSKTNDLYYFTTLSALYRIKTNRKGMPVFDYFRKY